MNLDEKREVQIATSDNAAYLSGSWPSWTLSQVRLRPLVGVWSVMPVSFAACRTLPCVSSTQLWKRRKKKKILRPWQWLSIFPNKRTRSTHFIITRKGGAEEAAAAAAAVSSPASSCRVENQSQVSQSSAFLVQLFPGHITPWVEKAAQHALASSAVANSTKANPLCWPARTSEA